MIDGPHCHKPDCAWLKLPSLRDLKPEPTLTPNPELSGIGVILGFSITAYLTVTLLIFHYVTVYDYRRTSLLGRDYTNPVDRGVLTFIREKIISWQPSRRFEYAMEKSVLILSDTQLVTGLAILIAGYSQLDCGITSYHWQIMVFVAWFSSFSFLSAMAFLENYFQANNSLRLIRVFFMFVLGGLMIAALLPTGSSNWLDALQEYGPFYPGLSAECFYQQLSLPTYSRGGPRVYSMVFSVLIVGLSYIHSGIRLFDPTAEFSRKYLRAIPGNYFKKALFFLEQRASRRGVRAAIWTVPYFVVFASFSSARALYDFAESMLAEIVWLGFAIAWGSIKVWGTRALAWVVMVDGKPTTAQDNPVGDEDAWSFGQTLPLILLLLPVLSMLQSYLDNEAKAQDALHRADSVERTRNEAAQKGSRTVHLAAVDTKKGEPKRDLEASDPTCSIATCSHAEAASEPSCSKSTAKEREEFSCNTVGLSPISPTTDSSLHHDDSPGLIFERPHSRLPGHPYHSFFRYHWYRDHVYLLVCQTLMLGCFMLWIETATGSVLGISYLLRSRLFLIWLFGFIPLSSLIHLAGWYVGGCMSRRIDGAQDWLKGRGKWSPGTGTECRWWRRATAGQWVYWLMRSLWKIACLTFTFFGSIELAGPNPIWVGGDNGA